MKLNFNRLSSKIEVLLLISFFIIVFIIYRNPKESFKNNNFFAVIVTTYNAGPKYLEKCLKSIEHQTFKNYNVCILDDASNKDIDELHYIIKKYADKNNWEYVLRKENVGPLGGRVEAINKLDPKDEDIIVSIDGDDELYDEQVFDKINKYYTENDILITFGNYVNVRNNKTSLPRIKCKKFNFKDVAEKTSFRKTQWIYSHLKTFKYKLYKRLNHKDLKRDGKYLKSATDMALMYPMLEMSNGKFKCIPEILYKYNQTHPESHNVNSSKLNTQTLNAKYVKRLPIYKPEYYKDNTFVIIVTTYNPGLLYLKRCMNSIKEQKYKNYKVCIVNDASNKNQAEIKSLINKYCEDNKWNYIHNDENLGMLLNFRKAVKKMKCQDNDVLISIDGDDELYDENVLTNLNNYYDYSTLLTFGNFIVNTQSKFEYNPNKCERDWEEIAENKSFRDGGWHYSHLKTFRHKVYKNIKEKDFKIDNKFIKSATDHALMFPMLEMIGNKFKCIPKPMYIYNQDHSESNNKNFEKFLEQTQNANIIKNKPKYNKIF